MPEQGDQAEDVNFAMQEDVVMTALLLSDKRGKAMPADAALRYFSREFSPLLTGVFDHDDSAESARLCRIGFETFEAIDALPSGKRLKAYRALLSMPAPEHHE